MKNLLFIFLLLPFFAHSQGVASTKEMEDNTIYLAPQSSYVKGTNNLNGAVNLKRIRIDSLTALAKKGVTQLIANKAELSYVDSQLATKTTTTQVNTIIAPKMDSTRTKTLLTLKADVTALNSKVETTTFNTALSSKANSTDLTAKENTTDVNAKLNFKAPVLNPVFQGDAELNNIGNGYIIKSPNGTRFRLTVSNSGDIIAQSL